MASNTLYTSYSQHSNATITVTNTSELNAAMAQLSSSGGGTIELDGNGGPYKITGNGIGDSNNPILIKAVDPATPPHITEIYLQSSSHVTMTQLNVDSTTLANPLPYHDVRISSSDNIEFVDNTMSSNASGYLGVTGGVKGGSAALIRDSQNINFSDNFIQNYTGGAGFLEINGLTFNNNEMVGIQHDGFQAGGLQNAAITNNYMHDFHGSTQQVNHSDFIMIWGTNAKSVTTNVDISGNVLDSGTGAAYQGIFIGNNRLGSPGPEGQMFQNINIYDNVIHTSMHHGLTIGQTQGANIYDNTVLFNPNAYTQADSTATPTQAVPWIMTSNAPGSVVTGNVAGIMSLNGGSDPSVNNYLLDYNNPNSPAYVENHIVNSSGTAGLDLRDLSFLPNSPLYGNFGSTLSSTPDANGQITAVMRLTELQGYRGAVQLTGDLSLGSGSAPLDPNSSSYVWTLDDGTVINGIGGTHVFQTPGNHQVTLQVTDSAGNVDTITRTFNVQDQTNFDINFNNGAVDTSGNGAQVLVNDPGNNSFVQGLSGQGFHLTGNNHIQIGKSLDGLYDLDTFQVDFDIKLDNVGTSGRLVGIHTSWDLKMLSNGALRFTLPTDQGNFVVSTGAGAIPDTSWHDISVQYDGPSSTLEILVDGNVVASGAATGTTASAGSHGLVLGEYFGTSVQAVVDNFSMAVPPSSVYGNLTSSGTVVNQPTTPITPVTPPAPLPPVTDPDATVVTPPADDTSTGTGSTDTSTGSTDTSTGSTDTSTGTGSTDSSGSGSSTTDTDTGSGTTNPDSSTGTGSGAGTDTGSGTGADSGTGTNPDSGSGTGSGSGTDSDTGTATDGGSGTTAPQDTIVPVNNPVGDDEPAKEILSAFNKSMMKMVSKFAAKGGNGPNKPISKLLGDQGSNLTLRDMINLISDTDDESQPATTTHGIQINGSQVDDEVEENQLMLL